MVITKETLGQAWSRIMRENSGLKCPKGCHGCLVRLFGLYRHLRQRHKYSKKQANKYIELITGFNSNFGKIK